MSKRSGRRGNCDQTGLAGNLGCFFRELGSKKEGGSQQIGYKLAKLSFKGGTTSETTSVEEEPVRAMQGLAWFQFTRKSREVSDKSEVVGDLLGTAREVLGLRDTAVDSRARILS